MDDEDLATGRTFGDMCAAGQQLQRTGRRSRSWSQGRIRQDPEAAPKSEQKFGGHMWNWSSPDTALQRAVEFVVQLDEQAGLQAAAATALVAMHVNQLLQVSLHSNDRFVADVAKSDSGTVAFISA